MAAAEQGMEHLASDQELDAWEMVSSSEEGGSQVGEEAAAAAAALAASFLAAEPLSPLAAARAAAAGAGSAGDTLLPGSPDSAQLLQLMAADAPAAPSLAAASDEGEGEAAPLPPITTFVADSSGSGGMADAGLPSTSAAALAAVSPPGPATLAGPGTPLGGGASGSTAMRRSSSLRLRVVRSDQLDSLEAVVAEMEKNAGKHKEELALARQRLNSMQAKLAEESHEACRLRKIAMIACSICAFLGLKALMGGPRRASYCGGQAAACAPLNSAPPRAPCVAHSVHEPPVPLLQRKVAIEVEPLAAAAP
jgi:uncharacterized coiled-coil protein SlyX